MNQSILDPASCHSNNVRTRIVSQLWPSDESYPMWNNFCVYFEKHYAIQCVLSTKGRSLKTHQDIAELAAFVSENCERPKNLLVQDAKLMHPRSNEVDKELSDSIEFIVRLWLMINLGNPTTDICGVHMLPQSNLPWPDELSLRELLAQTFTRVPVREIKRMRFSRFLNVISLRRIGGFKVHWTENVLDHLRFDEDHRVLFVFQHVSVLSRLKVSDRPVLPENFLDETIRTIALLLPPSDPACYSWLLEHGHALDPGLQSLPRAPREVNRYSFWRDQLLLLEEFFDEAEPTTWSQWWYDRRKKAQWYTFWVAIWVLILTIFFGLIQSVTGVLQAWKAFN